jgi:hypothetical protein
MKIKRITDDRNTLPEHLQGTFQLEVTGHEIIAIFDCLMEAEGGSRHRVDDRLGKVLGDEFDYDTLNRLRSGLVRGRIE